MEWIVGTIQELQQLVSNYNEMLLVKPVDSQSQDFGVSLQEPVMC